MKKERGFTLIEILVTIAIISLLGSLASIGVIKAMRSAKIKQAETDLAMISSAIITLADATGRWPNKAVRTTPGNAKVLDLTVDSAGLLGSDGSYPNWNGPYCDDIMTDPWGNPYFFDPKYKGGPVVVGSCGPNGKRNDADDICTTLLDD
jgi:general secretion pathway protein G